MPQQQPCIMYPSTPTDEPALGFAPVTLEVRHLFDRYARSGVRNCDNAFANIFCWQNTYDSEYAEYDDFLIIRFRHLGRVSYMLQHAGTGASFSRIIPILEADARKNGMPLRICSLTAEDAHAISASFGGKFALAAHRDKADYIYDTRSLRTLAGRRYQPKRNHLNRFSDLYSYEYVPLTPQHRDHCLQLESRWRTHHADKPDEQTAEQRAIVRALDNFEALGLSGGAIYIDGRMAAFTYGAPLNDDTFDIFVEKADTSYEGIFPAINKLFAETIPPQYIYTDREEDMGIEGLRRSKLSYHPLRLEYKHTLLALTPQQREVKRLWCEVFGDGGEFADDFLITAYDCGAGTLLHHDNAGRVVAMLHTIPMTAGQNMRAAYIYGVATDARCRRQGLASRLLTKALQTARNSGCDFALLIPAGEALHEFYRRAGFRTTGIKVRFGCDFDFGTGIADNDIAMVCPFTRMPEVGELTLDLCGAGEAIVAQYSEC